MNGPRTARSLILGALALGLALLGCGRLSPRTSMTENQPPEITLDAPSFGAGAHFTWRAHDPDGRIDHYVYAVNPRSVDRVDASWVRTEKTSAVVAFPRAAEIGGAVLPGKDGPGPQIFTVRAVDDRGAESAPVSLAVFDSTELAPTVVIDNPRPNPVFTPIVGPTVEIRWSGIDFDGHIVRYKFQLFEAHNPDFPNISDFISTVMNDPDTLRALYAPDFPGWDSLPVGKPSVRYSNLVPNQIYLFAITAIDNDGNYDPVFSANKNLLTFFVSEADIGRPSICVSSPMFNYCSQIGGDLDLSYEATTAAFPVSWFAVPQTGSDITGYRWVLDPPDTTDLGDQKGGPNHWTAWDPSNTSTTVGPFAAGSQHTLYVQARDNLDHVSTLRLRLSVVGFTPARPLLVVDDTRLTPDQINGSGVYDPPRGTWPSAAELDTFLYARGGNPWQGYAAGTLSSPGILNGYDFDTVGTRGSLSGVVPLSVLSQYRQVIWFTDDVGATYTEPPFVPGAPTTLLRLMSSPGQMNTLAAYVAQGGKLWLSGGGAAYATLIAWGNRNTPAGDWTNIDRELVPGRFMYDLTHWRSAVGVRSARQALVNTPDWAPWPNAAPGRGWSGHGFDHSLSQPDYGKLAAIQVLSPRTCSSDPPPPQRFCNSFYLVQSYPAEFIGRIPPNASPPNYVQEDVDPRSNQEQLESTLDTLYTAVGGVMPEPLPVMTYYHGFESGPMVFSGFPVWYFQKAQCQKLVDFVLQDIWGLAKQPTTTATVASRRR